MALQLDHLLTCAGLAVDGLRDSALGLDLIAGIGLLLVGELGDNEVLAASTAPDLGRELDVLKPASVSSDLTD